MVGRFIDPGSGKPIHPEEGMPSELLRASVVINNPVRMKWHTATGERLPGHTANDYGKGQVHEAVEDNLTGLFGIDANFLDWDLNGKASGTFGGRTRACLYHGEITYKVSGPLTIDRDKLVVTEEDLKDYLKITGNQLKLSGDNSNSTITNVLHTPLIIQENPVIRLPRLDYYTPEELADYWRDELGITIASASRVWHYVNVGRLKTSLRYEYPDGRGWFFDEAPARTSMIDILNAPPAEKYYIRLQEAERFETEDFHRDFLPQEDLKNNANENLRNEVEAEQVAECNKETRGVNPISAAATLLKRHQTAEIDQKVEEIMNKIHGEVQKASQNRSLDRVINHIRYIRETGISDENFDSVKRKVAAKIKSNYGDVGFTSLSRRPIANEPYLLPK